MNLEMVMTMNYLKPSLTLDELIEKATKAREESKLGGRTVVHLCEQGREYIRFIDAVLDQDTDGAVFVLMLDGDEEDKIADPFNVIVSFAKEDHTDEHNALLYEVTGLYASGVSTKDNVTTFGYGFETQSDADFILRKLCMAHGKGKLPFVKCIAPIDR
jgi:hypothetical protein